MNRIKVKINEVIDLAEQKAIKIAFDYIYGNIKDNVKMRYGEEIKLNFNHYPEQQLKKWLDKYDKKYKFRPKSNIYSTQLSNSTIFLKFDKATFAIAKFGTGYLSDRQHYRSSEEAACSIYIFGRHYKKYYDDLKDKIISNTSDRLTTYNITGVENNPAGFDATASDSIIRDIDSLFYEDGVKESILDHIDTFIKNKEIYESRNLSYKTGILLYGEPGTGKTSLTVALANKYKYDLVVIDMNTFENIDISKLTASINADTNINYMILLEDIDTIYSLNREDKNIDRDEKKIVNKMLQFLDSSSSPKNVIFVATTNDISVLDDAIKRDGRFDLIKEINPIDKNKAKCMIESFGIIDYNAILSTIPGNKINQSSLQTKILSYFKDNINSMEN